MKETIQRIKELATVTENIYLLHNIDILETEIEIAIMDAKTEVYNSLLKKL
tara:strand:+ start:866 stop:1018 length:153 start_codon:yes stop_codon:yes gene_type:complete